jgi:hypothetical protein
MTRLQITGPTPEPGITLCAVCVAEWKDALITLLGIDQAWLAKHLAGPPDQVKVICWPVSHSKRPPVEEAVTWAPSDLMGMAIVPMCFTHAPALASGAPPAPPGLTRPKLIPGMS